MKVTGVLGLKGLKQPVTFLLWMLNKKGGRKKWMKTQEELLIE